MLGTLGGFFALFSRFVLWIMTYFNGFILDNSMIKRLYSVHDEDYQPKDDTLEDKEDEGTTDDQKNASISDKMFHDIKSRKSFSASYWPFYIRKNCILKYLLCQCNRKPSRSLKLFANAQKKLNVELDILEIVKMNRLCRLFLMVNTKPRERELVKFFDEYTLYASEDHKNDADNFEDTKGVRNSLDNAGNLNFDNQKKFADFEDGAKAMKATSA